MENKIFKGYWYLPKNKKNKVHGTLTYELNGNTILVLDENLKISDTIKSSDIPIILGENSNGMKITLLKNFATKTDHTLKKVKRVSSNIFFIGIHFDSIDKILISEMQIKYNTLSEFLLSSSIINKSELVNFNLTYQQKESFKFSIDEKFNGEFYTKLNKDNGINYFNINEEKILILSSLNNKKNKYDSFVECHFKFQHFLTFATHLNSYPTDIVCKFNNEYFKVCYNVYLSEIDKEKVDLTYFNFHEIPDFRIAIKNWYKIFDDYESSINLFFSDMYAIDKRIRPNNFLTIMNSLESFHRLRYPDAVKPDKDYIDSMKDLVLNSFTSKKDIDFITGYVKYWDSMSLKDRITELFEKYKTNSFETLLDKSQYKKFIRKIVETRNYYTHYDKDKKNIALKGEELYKSYLIIKLLLINILLFEMGFQEKDIDEIHKIQNYRYWEIDFI